VGVAAAILNAVFHATVGVPELLVKDRCSVAA
jgi:hypothetical protein